MKALMVGEFRRNFSKILDIVKRGEEIIIRTGRKKENIAVLVPFEKYTGARQRKLGILENKASFIIRDDFKITDEELLRKKGQSKYFFGIKGTKLAWEENFRVVGRWFPGRRNGSLGRRKSVPGP